MYLLAAAFQLTYKIKPGYIMTCTVCGHSMPIVIGDQWPTGTVVMVTCPP